MRSFFTDQSNIGDTYIKITDKDEIKHILKILRLKKGDIVNVSDQTEWEYKGVIEETNKDVVKLRITDKQTFAKEPVTHVTLFQGIPNGSKMDTIVQKCVELGVYSIVPVFMNRTVITEEKNFAKQTEKWQKISDKAAKQCKRGRIPEIREETYFNDIIDELKTYDIVIFPYENEKDFSIKNYLRSLVNNPKNIAIIIGPEGGFSDREVGKLDEIGAERVTLGRTILRTETAGMVTLAMIMYEFEL